MKNVTINLPQQPLSMAMVILGQKHKVIRKNQVMGLSFPCKNVLTLGMDMIKTKEGNMTIQIERRLSKCTTKECRKCTHNIPFLMRKHNCDNVSTCMALNWDLWASFGFLYMQKWLKKNWKNVTIKITFGLQKGPETSEQSARNVTWCKISMGWEWKKQEEHLYQFKHQQQVHTYVHHHGKLFFCQSMADCCELLQTACGYCVDALWFAVYLSMGCARFFESYLLYI